MAQNYGSKRIVVGAHYGLRDWLSQRITAAVMALFTLLVLVQFLWPWYAKDANGERIKDVADQYVQITGYDKWAGIFSTQWMKLLTFVVIVSLAWHAWVGMRDVWMDYVKPVGTRLLLQVISIVWLVGCTGWAIQVLWRL
ncbi:MAG TPA: succinate dehydrogenase, hydrophobic membrane anchor protein [Albitalea sp.]|nr:succinate dehydrogenase, hydrophobic membrane anchor protein [Albitalea sp.]